jgi:LuxR family transcriptional regulator, maltose regulon positive regulatory protein
VTYDLIFVAHILFTIFFMLLDTKLYPADPPEFAIRRERLFKQLSAASESGSHVLISAGAGFGKSTLLVQWLHDWNVIPAWFSIDTLDNNPHRFFRYLATSLGSRYNVNSDAVEMLLKAAGTADIQPVLETIFDLIASIDEQVYIVFDDFHLIENQEIIRGIEFLMKHLPDKRTFIFLSRFDPQISLSKYRLNQKLLELRESDLRFNRDEIVELLQPVISDEDQLQTFAEILQEKTEGWVVGLRLGILAYSHENSGYEFVDRFSGSHVFVADYLMEEVLGQLTPEQEQLLLVSSLFQRFTCKMLGSLLKQDVSAYFEQIKKTGFFLIQLDDADEWFRLHHLVQDLLRKRAYTNWNSQRIKTYYLDSGYWLEDRLLIDEALQSFHKAGNIDELIRIISTYGLRFIASGDLKTVIDWLNLIPENLRLSTPDLCVIEGWIASINQQIDRNEYISNIAERLYVGNGESCIEDIGAHLALLKANYLVQKEGTEPSEVDLLLVQAEKQANSSNLLLHSIIQLYRGNIYRMSGELEKALAAYRKTLHYSEQLKNYSLILPTTTAVGEINILQGKFDEAEKLLKKTLDNIYLCFSLVRIPKVGLLHILLAIILYEKNQLKPASENLEKAEDISDRTNDYNALVICYDVKARLHLLHNETAKAREYLDRAENLSEKRHLLYYSAYLVHLTFLIRQKQGNRIAIEQCLDLVEKHTKWYGFWLGQLELTRVKTLFELERYAEAKEEASGLKKESKIRGAGFVELQANCWLSVIHRKTGNMKESLEMLHQALIMAEKAGIIRPILDTGPEMVQILKAYTSEKIYHGIISLHFIQKLFSEFETELQRTPEGLSEPLSERELEVLRLIAAGMTNKEIGEQLFLAVGTVKKHSYTIYQKLDVKNRLQAVQKSKDLRLI